MYLAQRRYSVYGENRILYIARHIPSYRTGVLELLNERLNGRLVVCSGASPNAMGWNSTLSCVNTTYEHFQLTNRWLMRESIHVQRFKPALEKFANCQVVLLEESPRSIALPFLIRHARHHEIGTVLWGHFSSNSRPFSASNWQDRYRIWLARQADALVAYTDGIKKLITPFVDDAKVFVARNTLDSRVLHELYRRLAQEGKVNVRKRLHLPVDDPVVVFIGRLIEGKGTLALIETIAKMQVVRNCTLLVIGDGPELKNMKSLASSMGINVRFLGAIPDLHDSAPFLYAADVLLNPGYLGLSVNHAFFFGLPVIAPAPRREFRLHSPEWEYVEHGKNGFLVQDSDPTKLAQATNLVLDNLDQFSEAARRYATNNLDVNTMVDGLVDAISYARHRQGRN